MYKIALLAALLIPLSLPAQSAIYRTVDEHGNVVFTDTPPADGVATEQVDMRETNTTPPPPSIPMTSSPKPTEPEEAPPVTVTITAPADDTTIPMGPGNFSVSASAEPSLESDQHLQLFIDGSASGESQLSGNWGLKNIDRGTHSLVVKVMNTEGDEIAVSAPVRVHVQRPSIIKKGRPAIAP